MALYTIEAPDGRKIKIEAADEATAMRGAQEYAAANPAQSQAMTSKPNLTSLPGPFGGIAGMMGFDGLPREPDTSRPEEWDPPGALIPVQFKKGTGEPRWAMPGVLTSMLDAAQLPGEVLSGETPFDPRLSMRDQDPETLDRAATAPPETLRASVAARSRVSGS